MRFLTFLFLVGLSFGSELGVKTKVENLLAKWNVKVLEVRDLGSLYEVDVFGAPRVLYFTKDFRYMIIGGVFDPKTGKNLTYQRLKQLEAKNEKVSSNTDNR